ncbi:MAG: phosphatase PAP2 family protein [Flavihumibacter sp.]
MRKLLPVVCLFACLGSKAQLFAIDKYTLIELEENRRPGAVAFFQHVSNTTNALSMAMPATLLLAGAIGKNADMQQKALYIGESMLVAGVISTGMKYAINRERPFRRYPTLITAAGSGGSPSFPSGHTSEAFSAATSLVIAYPKWWVAVPAFTWSSTVGVSRMYLGVHYPSDIAVGALVGAGSAWATHRANDWLRHRKAKAKALPAY